MTVCIPGAVDLLSADFDVDRDDITLLNEILNTPAAPSSSEFSSEWNAAFGAAGPPLMAGATMTSSDSDSKISDFFMPSSLLDMTAGQFLLSRIIAEFIRHVFTYFIVGCLAQR